MSRPILLEVELTGMKELREALRRLPDDLAQEGADIVRDATEATKTATVQGYPSVSGELRDGVKTEYQRTAYGLKGRVRSTAPHAHLYEFGTADRKTSAGWPRGQVMEHPVLVPASERERTTMNERLIDLVRRAGFEVSGVA